MTEQPTRQRRWAPAFAGATAVAFFALALWLYLREPAPPPAPPPRVGPPQALLDRLARGVNLSNWLQHGKPTEAARYAPDDSDFRRIRALGLGHVRLPVDPAALLNDRGLPDAKGVGALKRAIASANREGLLVVLALQLPPEMKESLAKDETARVALAGTWRWLAGALRNVPANNLVFEPLNETGITDALVSRELLIGLIVELRGIVPTHTLVVEGHGYSGIPELAALQPLADPNLVYAFHFYEPHNFTHQGADWGDPAWKALRSFPYPSSPEAVAPRLAALPPKARDLLRWHGEERWNRERIGKELAVVAQWGRDHQVTVWCGEFGALKKRVAPADRAAWLRDVRLELEARGIGWSHWDYAGPFGIVSGTQGHRTEDAAAIGALGMGSGG